MNNIMKKFTKIFILSIFTILMIGSFAKSAFAEVPTVEFQNNPLFGEANFAPGNSISKYIILNNNVDNARVGIIRALEIVNEGIGEKKLGDVTHLTIKQGDVVLYNNKTFSEFFSDSEQGEINLSSVAAHSSVTFDLIVTFDADSENEYQNSTMSFDLKTGFPEDSQTDTDTVSVGGGNSGSYVTLGPKTLTISDEQALNISNVDSFGIVTITWNTNLSATSQVIYGPMPGPYNLKLETLPNLGYPLGSTEDGNKVMSHSVFLSGLTPGQTYVYRVVSRASPATVSYEHQFTVPLFAENNNPILNNNNLNNAGQVLGAQNNPLALGANNDGGLDTTENAGNLNNQGGNLLGASAGNIMGLPSGWFWALLVALLLLIVLITRIIYRRRKSK